MAQEQVDELRIADICRHGGRAGKCNIAALCHHQYRHVLKGKVAMVMRCRF